eukprot:1195471-Prorocentrum_minimum.AAC.1
MTRESDAERAALHGAGARFEVHVRAALLLHARRRQPGEAQPGPLPLVAKRAPVLRRQAPRQRPVQGVWGSYSINRGCIVSTEVHPYCGDKNHDNAPGCVVSTGVHPYCGDKHHDNAPYKVRGARIVSTGDVKYPQECTCTAATSTTTTLVQGAWGARIVSTGDVKYQQECTCTAATSTTTTPRTRCVGGSYSINRGCKISTGVHLYCGDKHHDNAPYKVRAGLV